MQSLAVQLSEQGVRHAFGVTGGGPSWALISALEEQGVRYHPVAHEAAGAIMAGTVSRISGVPSVSISVRGPGLANMLPGIVHNHLENNPAVSIAEALGDDVPRYRRHKRIDQCAMLAPVVKGICSLAQRERLPSLLRHAAAEVPGPVHLELCAARQGMPWGEDAHASAETRDHPTSAACRDAMVERIRRAQRPLVIVGSLATRRAWGQRLAALHVPVCTTVSAKGALDERLPQSAGVFTGDGKELAPERHLCAEADLVIGMGLRNAEVLSPKGFQAPLLLVDEIDAQLSGGFQPERISPYLEEGDVAELFAALAGKQWGMEQVARCRAALRNALLDAAWIPAHCFEALNRLALPHALVLDTGSFCTIGEHVWDAGPDRAFLGSSNGRYMGVGLPSAIGMAFARPQLPVFCAVGDGGIRMYPAEMKLAVEERLPVCVLLMSDGQYGSIACVPQQGPRSRRAVTIANPSWLAAMEGMGVPAKRIDSAETLQSAVEAWDRGGPLFLEAHFDPASYGAMTARLR